MKLIILQHFKLDMLETLQIVKFYFRSSSPTPPMSLISNSTTTTTASSSTVALAAPLQPDPALTTPKRPNRFLGLFPPAKPPLSPITSSPEMSPNADSSPAFPRQKQQLHLPHILSKLVPSGSLTSLVKVSSVARMVIKK